MLIETQSLRVAYRWQPWAIWFLAVGFYFYENILQVSTSVMTNELMRDLHLDGLALGNLAAFYFYAYAPTQIPVGLLLDRFGPRKLITAANLLVITGCFLFARANTLFAAEIGRALIGFGSAFAVVSAMKLFSCWFPLERFALLTGLMVTAGFSGSIVGEKSLAPLVQSIGWRNSTMIFVLVGGVIATLAWLIVRDTPTFLTATSEIEEGPEASPTHDLWVGLKKVMGNPQSWIVAVYGGLMFAPTSIFGAFWGVPFLSQTYHISTSDAASINIFLFLGWIVGAPIGGWISDTIKLRKPLLYVGSAGALITMSLILYVPDWTTWQLELLLFGFGCASSGFLPSFSIIGEISPHKAKATALGFMNMFNMFGGALGQPLVGFLLDRSWDGTLQDGAKLYSLSAYHSALTMIPVMILVAFLILPLIRETYCKSLSKSSW